VSILVRKLRPSDTEAHKGRELPPDDVGFYGPSKPSGGSTPPAPDEPTNPKG